MTDSDLRRVVRLMMAEYSGMTMERISEMTDDQLYDLIPGLTENAMKTDAMAERQKRIGQLTVEWKKTHSGDPDLFNDIMPLLGKTP